MKVTPLAIPEVLLIEPSRFGDARGFFSEVWKKSALSAAGLAVEFVQDNHSFSRDVGVLRGLHFQRPPHAQGKLVRVVRGRILDVVVDIREGSPTYGQHVTAEISAANWRQIWVPRGFAHGLITLEPDTEVLYKVDGEYNAEADGGIAWNDPALGIEWPLPVESPTLSAKDANAPRLAEAGVIFPRGSW
ncbi:dTDP-4-dehydrorhamnose 3,5-epimerase [Roseococcus suduntuyensis]|uniref:dTDP-4-dehydrorhamnose 3,5-epimerase n=1 Tax=Roseococcus suduntuyensis TaxID=455361 RepID=A0A840AK52_9PROT|nr:dTDP-4-dehydrorhamnose 3,5-epimerase [Roseococcus suduntuyensis]MBB3900504.1 dTDP-4-dehydrorhamnose 3,5-epimerase [Roseococcus suduntuyensis]